MSKCSNRCGCSSFRYRYRFVFVCTVSVIGTLELIYSKKFRTADKYKVPTPIRPNVNDEETSALDDLGSRPALKECKELSEDEAASINKVLSDRRKVFLENQQFLNDRFASIAEETGIEPGGVWKPKDCISQHQLILVIPYRNRSEQLTYFLPYIHEFLQYQKISYRIIIVEQSEEKKFNRGKLMNVGYVEGLKLDSTQSCFLFHDVDLIPENVLNKFYCYDEPLHLARCYDYRNYTLPFQYSNTFGLGYAIRASQFKLINGFSNSFWGWGSEDDDFLLRIWSKKLKYKRYGPEVARYTSLQHAAAERSASNERFIKMLTGRFTASLDGVSNLEYTVLDYQLKPLYTWIKVRF